ncbi:hypothetical protein O6H91_18G040800 [Diphasiastrum complanatum]|uniref:Uncharacterized protein n=1 Tax=Diphasiastrum complanatum TaxID=34168 RepID=A0ACC2B0G1_DIPCM|nr:hypothetical protein O6H91_Y407200 [Diphasiastrum complanatum]KAJ7523185.1 hypothetical protein O6H91_18G040800 [Diphasiastrum complanatum]
MQSVSMKGLKIKFNRKRDVAVASVSQSKPVEASPNGAGDRAEEGSVSGESREGMLKRKQASSPPSAAASNKKPARAESPIPMGPDGQPVEVVPGKGQQVSKDPKVIKQKLGQPHLAVSTVVQEEQNVDSQFDRDSEATAANMGSGVEVENISHGQLQGMTGTVSNAVTEPATDHKPDESTRQISSHGSGAQQDGAREAASGASNHVASTASPCSQKIQKHVVPTHAGWFSWNKIHALERRGVPEFFNGKSKTKTNELYMEYRNFLIHKYLEKPQRILSISDVQDLVVGDLNAVRHILEFLDHWGLINYQAPSGSSERRVWQGVPARLAESEEGELQAVSQAVPPLASLYQFDTPRAPSSNAQPVESAPVLAEAVVSEALSSTQGPAVEYHCNSCSADCSKRRYHCQKQADFDLCPDCFSDGKFGNGMSTAHFIRMDAVPETGDVDGGGWTDQETLLLLEALELYGDNWNDIAEHVATKSKAQCILHFIQMPIEDSFLEDTETASSRTALSTASTTTFQAGEHPGTPKTLTHTPPILKIAEQSAEVSKEANNSSLDEQQAQQEESVIKAITAASALIEGPSADGLVAFADSGNPVMAQVAFLAAMVGPRIAAAAAQSALMALSEEDPAASLAGRNTTVLDIPIPDSIVNKTLREGSELADKGQEAKKVGSIAMADTGENNSGEICASNQKDESEVEEPPSVDKVRNAAATALGAAAVKAKLLADQEEREIQRLVAIVIENQLKKLELKLKHFGELEVMLKEECDQVERARQKQYAERARLVSSRFGSPAPTQTHLPGSTTVVTSVGNRLAVPSSASATSMPVPQASGTVGSMGPNRPAVFTFGPRGVATPVPMSTPRPPGTGQTTIQPSSIAGSQANHTTAM